jgi:hypothetical protein
VKPWKTKLRLDQRLQVVSRACYSRIRLQVKAQAELAGAHEVALWGAQRLGLRSQSPPHQAPRRWRLPRKEVRLKLPPRIRLLQRQLPRLVVVPTCCISSNRQLRPIHRQSDLLCAESVRDEWAVWISLCRHSINIE